MNKLIEKYGLQLDVVYDDARFNCEKYDQVYYWNSTINKNSDKGNPPVSQVNHEKFSAFLFSLRLSLINFSREPNEV